MTKNTMSVTGRVIATKRHGHTIWGNPMMSVLIDTSEDGPGHYGIERVAWDTPGAVRCYECRRAWVKDVTPASRCPWEGTCGQGDWYRISNDSGIVYGIENAEFRDTPHTFELTGAGRISGRILA